MKKLWLLAMVAFSACRPEAPKDVFLHDVSIVWPLPATPDRAADDGFLTAAWPAAYGELLPHAVFDGLPHLTRVDEPHEVLDNLVVVAARLDPCFREGGPQASCQPNVRLVFQPLVLDEQGNASARDAAVHAFYNARSRDDVLALIADLARDREQAGQPHIPLGLHPLAHDTAGRRKLRERLAPLLGEKRLVRVTTTDVHADNSAWTFQGFNRGSDGQLTPMVIGGLDTTEQHVLSLSTPALRIQVSPRAAQADDFSLLLDEADASQATLAQRQAAYDAAARIENPTHHDPGTTDCASCHVAAVARHRAAAQEPLAVSPGAYASASRSLETTGDFSNPRVVRAFGYRFGELFISPRVVHETAQVADDVQAEFRGRE